MSLAEETDKIIYIAELRRQHFSFLRKRGEGPENGAIERLHGLDQQADSADAGYTIHNPSTAGPIRWSHCFASTS